MATKHAATPDEGAFNCPISGGKFDRVLDVIGLTRDSRLFDAGCGTGELLIRASEQYGSSGLGVDVDARAIEQARTTAVRRGVTGVDFVLADASTFSPDRPISLAACVGSTHAYGGLAGTVATLERIIGDGGHVLLGDIYWKRPPDAEYLALLGEAAGDHFGHAENVAVGVGVGLTPVYATTASDDEWDDFEGRFWARKLRAALDEPAADERAKRIEWLRRWQDGYLRWGRETMGFGLYLFQKLA